MTCTGNLLWLQSLWRRLWARWWWGCAGGTCSTYRSSPAQGHPKASSSLERWHVWFQRQQSGFLKLKGLLKVMRCFTATQTFPFPNSYALVWESQIGFRYTWFLNEATVISQMCSAKDKWCSLKDAALCLSCLHLQKCCSHYHHPKVHAYSRRMATFLQMTGPSSKIEWRVLENGDIVLEKQRGTSIWTLCPLTLCEIEWWNCSY